MILNRVLPLLCRSSPTSHPRPCPAKFIMFSTKFIILSAKSIILSAKSIMLKTNSSFFTQKYGSSTSSSFPSSSPALKVAFEKLECCSPISCKTRDVYCEIHHFEMQNSSFLLAVCKLLGVGRENCVDSLAFCAPILNTHNPSN